MWCERTMKQDTIYYIITKFWAPTLGRRKRNKIIKKGIILFFFFEGTVWQELSVSLTFSYPFLRLSSLLPRARGAPLFGEPQSKTVRLIINK